MVDPEQLRKEVRADEFARLRARRLTNDERAELKAKVSEVQKRILARERKIKNL
jgi:hypothetical protein